MAKLGLVFICVFLMVQLSLAARVARDAPETPAKSDDPNAFNINEALSTLTQGIQKTFSKENVDKVMASLGETGEKLKQFGESLITKAQATAAEISNSGKKDETKA